MKAITYYFDEKKLESLCENIGMPTGATELILSLFSQMNSEDYQEIWTGLFDPETAEQAIRTLQALHPEPDGMRKVTILLLACLRSYELYQEKGIADSIFYATMGFFSRCVKEGKQWDGQWTFDRSFWGWRQLNLIIFRLGELEYEMRPVSEDNAKLYGLTANQMELSLHIPSDADLSDEKLQESFKFADEFFQKYFQLKTPLPMTCGTWLLSPHLLELLPPTSGIARFQSLFDIRKIDPDNPSYKLWVFGREKEPENFAETTSLQRKIKAYILDGNSVGVGYGIVKRAYVKQR